MSQEMNYLLKLFLFTGLLGILSCDLEKEITVDLPAYEPQLVVECYLQVGQPYRLLLTESSAYFEPPALPLVDDATVVIKHNGISHTLENGLILDQETSSVYNYSLNISPMAFNEVYELKITDRNGEQLTAQTLILDTIPIKELELLDREIDDQFSLLTRVADPPASNFYRRTLHLGENIIDGFLEQDFATNDDFIGEDSELVFGSGFEYESGDTLIAGIYHINEAYYNYLESIETAINSNGNPFVQPEAIRSNIKGGIGIFTGFSLDQKMVVID